MMFTKDDISSETIDGKSYITFQPNTIVYAVDVNSKLAQQVKSSQDWSCLAYYIYRGFPSRYEGIHWCEHCRTKKDEKCLV